LAAEEKIPKLESNVITFNVTHLPSFYTKLNSTD